MEKCIECNTGTLAAESVVDFIEYKGQRLPVTFLFSRCTNCGDECVYPAHIQENEAAVKRAKQEFDGLMSPAEMQAARLQMGLTQEQAAQIFGGGRNAFSKYERGEVTQSQAMDTLIKVCLSHPEILQELKESNPNS